MIMTEVTDMVSGAETTRTQTFFGNLANGLHLLIHIGKAVDLIARCHRKALCKSRSPDLLIIPKELGGKPLAVVDNSIWGELWIPEDNVHGTLTEIILGIEEAIVEPLSFLVRFDLTQMTFDLLLRVLAKDDQVFFGFDLESLSSRFDGIISFIWDESDHKAS